MSKQRDSMRILGLDGSPRFSGGIFILGKQGRILSFIFLQELHQRQRQRIRKEIKEILDEVCFEEVRFGSLKLKNRLCALDL